MGVKQVSIKGAFTQIDTSGNRAVIVARKVLYMDGYDAFVCAIEGHGETEKRTGKQTSFAFTYDQTKKVIYLSEGYRDEERKEIVRARTLEVNRFLAGAIIETGITLKWLTPEENAQLKKEYQEKVTEQTPGAGERRFRCKNCGRLIPIGRSKCRKCGSTDIELTEFKSNTAQD